MLKKAFLILPLFLSVSLIIYSGIAFAVENVEEQYPTVEKTKPSRKKASDEIMAGFIPKNIGSLKVDLSASSVFGYDSNVYLDRYDEDGSIFMQNSLGVKGQYPIKESIFTLRGAYDFITIKYFKFSDPDLIDNMLGLGLDTKIADNFLWSVDYLADFVGYPHDEQSEYTLNQVGTSLRHDITKWLYQKLGYEFFYKHYPKLKTRNSRGNLRLGDREDYRNTLFHQLGLYAGKRMFIKAENRVYINESNENYLDYYDYHALKSKVSLTYLITKKLYETLSFAYQYKAYEKRGVSDSDEDQRDHLFIYGASVYYDVIPNVTLGASFDYRKNYSNENVEKYDDYVISSGVYLYF